MQEAYRPYELNTGGYISSLTYPSVPGQYHPWLPLCIRVANSPIQVSRDGAGFGVCAISVRTPALTQLLSAYPRPIPVWPPLRHFA